METIVDKAPEGLRWALNRTIVGWKLNWVLDRLNELGTLNRTIVGWKPLLSKDASTHSFPFKSHHSGMETYEQVLDHDGVPALNRTIVGWKLKWAAPQEAFPDPLNRTIVGWKLGAPAWQSSTASTLNRTIVGWKQPKPAPGPAEVIPLNRTIVGWKLRTPA